MKQEHGILIFYFVLAGLLLSGTGNAQPVIPAEKAAYSSDHFSGGQFFNPDSSRPHDHPAGQPPRRGSSVWLWRWIFGPDWPHWPVVKNFSPGAPPEVRVGKGVLRVTPVGHSTFLIQMDGLNILTDPIWSERCSPVSWAGPRRHRAPGIRFEDLPAIDAILISHNHYDHLDLLTLRRLAEKGAGRAFVPIGNMELVRDAGITAVDELDWWQAVRLSPEVVLTLVPAQHFSSRTPWDRNKTLWGGFVISGPAGNVFYAGDTGYGPHFKEIARRFAPIKMAILPISPFRPQQAQGAPQDRYPSVHMSPAQAIGAHRDLGSELSIAAHFQVFQLGADGFDDAVCELALALKKDNLPPEAFVAVIPGQAISAPGSAMPHGWRQALSITPDCHSPSMAVSRE